MALLFTLPRSNQFDAVGQLMSGWTVEFYATNTSDPQVVYADSALSISLGAVVPTGDDGSLRPIYLDDTGPAYKIMVKDADGAIVPNGTIDPYLLGPSREQMGRTLYPRSQAEGAAAVVPIDYSYPPGDIRRYGAVNGQDSSSAITAAVAQLNSGGADLYVPAGVFDCTEAQTISYVGWRITGDDGVRSIIRFTGAGSAAFVISANAGVMRGVGFYNSGTWDHGLVLHSAGASSFYNVWIGGGAGGIYGFDSHGILIDDDYDGSGNNNNIRLFSCNSSQNDGCGIAWATPGADQNDIECFGCNFSFNDSHGMLLKGQANRVFGGIFEGNGGYGIQISEAADTPITSTRSIIQYPYLESNTLGGVHGGGFSLANNVCIDGLNANSGYTRDAGSEDFVVQPGNSSGPYLALGDPAAQLRVRSVTSVDPARIALAAEGTPTNIPLFLEGKGTGGVWLEAGNDSTNGVLKVGQNGSGIKGILFGTVNFGANTTALVSFGVTLPTSAYRIVIGANANNKTFGWTSKSTTGFSMTASSSSSDTVDWTVIY